MQIKAIAADLILAKPLVASTQQVCIQNSLLFTTFIAKRGMPLKKIINPKSKQNTDTGFGVNAGAYGGRFVNKDGTFNVKRRGVLLQDRISIFQKMIYMPLWEFLLTVAIFYLGINIVFAFIYYLPGVDDFAGLNEKGNTLAHLVHLFFFSSQTLTTVGYGLISPSGFWSNLIASFEALCGLLTFAIMTGLVYGRFARPRSYLLFSKIAVIAPYRGITGLMFRLASYKDRHILTDANVKVNMGLKVFEGGEERFKFFELKLERYRVDSLSMNWTVVHPIDDDSPIVHFSEEDLANAEAEIYVQLSGYDEVFAATVVQSTSYFFNEIIYGAKFKPMYYENNTTTVLELNKINEWEKAGV